MSPRRWIMTRDKELRRELFAQLRASLLEGKRGIVSGVVAKVRRRVKVSRYLNLISNTHEKPVCVFVSFRKDFSFSSWSLSIITLHASPKIMKKKSKPSRYVPHHQSPHERVISACFSGMESKHFHCSHLIWSCKQDRTDRSPRITAATKPWVVFVGNWPKQLWKVNIDYSW